MDGIARRKLLKTGVIRTVGLACCTGDAETLDAGTAGTDTDSSGDTDVPKLDLETLEAETDIGTFQANQAEDSYVSLVADGRAIGPAFAEVLGVSSLTKDDLRWYDGPTSSRSKESVDWPGIAEASAIAAGRNTN